MMITASKVTQKYQATIPLRIRRFLDLKQGDSVEFELHDDGEVRIRKREQPVDMAYANWIQETLTEWSDPEDEEAYRDL